LVKESELISCSQRDRKGASTHYWYYAVASPSLSVAQLLSTNVKASLTVYCHTSVSC